jgi:hypothetical protein
MLKGDLSYCAEIKCETYIQIWVKINAPDGYKGQGIRKGINQQRKSFLLCLYLHNPFM